MSNLMLTAVLGVKGKAMKFFNSESGEVNIVTTVVLIGIAIALALVFKEGISGLLDTLMQNITTNATNAISTN